MLRRIGSSHICAGGPATGTAPLALAAVLGGEGPARAPGQADDGRPEAAAILRTTGIEALSRLDGQPLSHWQRLAVAELLAGLPADTAGRIRQLVCVTQTPDRLIPTAAAVLRPALAPLGVAPAHQVDLASGCSGYADGLRLLEALQRCEGEGLQMDGLEVMNFVFATVVPSLLGFLAGRLAGVDPGRRCLVLHQANRFIVSAVEKRVRAAHPGLRLCGFQLGHIGNPGSASIPIALELARRSGALVGVERAIVCGFGVGLSCHMGEIAL
ncbi:MAG: 3-oxoacyl-[acyl-carrier-protein] synthase III C-terminal domain-containing protein [Prochlorococcaceae cyanobacterium]